MPENEQNTTKKKGRLNSDGLSKWMFNRVHQNNLVYDTCWEDPRLDHVALELTPKDVVMVITSAGCNALDYALKGPKHVHAVDMNPRQNALLELKIAAIRELDYEQFFQMFGRGSLPDFKTVYKEKLSQHLSDSARSYWDSRSKMFSGKGLRPSFYFYGTSGTFARLIKFYVDRIKRLRPAVNELLAAKSVEEQKEIYDRHKLSKTLWTPMLKFAMRRDMTLALLGVPRAQRQQIDRDCPGGILQFVIDSLETVLTKLPLQDNYFWHVYLTGQYRPDCCPEYLKEENFEKLKGGLVDRISIHTNTILGFLQEEKDVQISRYILLDHMDWLADVRADILAEEWQEMLDRAAPETRFLWRSAGLSVEFIDPISVKYQGNDCTLGDVLEYKSEVSDELHQIDRVHTYGCFYIAHLKNKTAANAESDANLETVESK
ncbi:MAG: BtaA family protein [Planctomycetaceae bacterium]|nr:BtaA family protein [Planctomycetaceae bacterium]